MFQARARRETGGRFEPRADEATLLLARAREELGRATRAKDETFNMLARLKTISDGLWNPKLTGLVKEYVRQLGRLIRLFDTADQLIFDAQKVADKPDGAEIVRNNCSVAIRQLRTYQDELARIQRSIAAALSQDWSDS